MFVSAADSLSLEAGRIAHILQPTFEYQDPQSGMQGEIRRVASTRHQQSKPCNESD